jgi:hypothetical protein
MLEQIPFILALDEESIGKIIFAVIAGVIWAVGSLVSWANKRQQEAKRRAQQQMMSRPPSSQPSPRARQRIAEGMAVRHPEVLLPPAHQRQRVRQGPPPVPPMRPPTKVPQPPKPARKSKASRLPPAPPLPPVPRQPQQVPSIVAAPTTAVAATPNIMGALGAGSLRKQFIIMEILQPPLALREERS